MTEHSSTVFVFFFLAEYASILLMSVLTAILFLGGYHYITISAGSVLSFINYFHLSAIFPYNNVLNTYAVFDIMFNNPVAIGALSGVTLGIKACFVVFCFIWTRASLPRIRFDQLMQFCWTVLLPLLFAFIILVVCIFDSFNANTNNFSLLIFLGFLKKINTPSKTHSFSKFQVTSGKDFILLVIGGLFVSIPSSYLSIAKNFGYSILCGAPILATNIIVYAASTGNATLDNLNSELLTNTTEINRLLDQLQLFISQFNQFITDNNIIVITDSFGNLDIDISNDVDNTVANSYSQRIQTFDNLIRHHIDEITELLETAYDIDARISALNNQHVSQLSDLETKLNTLKDSYKHK
jgi:NADH dehydrogenase